MKRILAMVISVALVATMAITGSIAYLQDTDGRANVMALGNVEIEQHEYERVPDGNGDYEKIDTGRGTGYKLQAYTQAKPLYPAVSENPVSADDPSYGSVTGWDSTFVYFDQLDSNPMETDASKKHANGYMQVLDGLNNVQDKFVFVENTGKTDAYIRTLIAYEAGSLSVDEWDELISRSVNAFWKTEGVGIVNINDNNYYVVEYVYDGNQYDGDGKLVKENGNGLHSDAIVHPGDWTYCSLAQVYMSPEGTNEDCENIDGNKNGTYDILTLSQAVQSAGFTGAQVALDTAFGKATAENVAEWFGGMSIPDYANSTPVSTADELSAALAEGGTILLTSNMDVENSAFVIPAGKAVVLDLAGNTLTVASDESKASCAIENKGELTIKNGTVTYKGVGDSSFGYGTNTINNSGKLVIDGATIINTTNAGSSNAIDNGKGSELIMKSGELKAEKIALRVLRGSDVTIDGGEITGKYAMQIYLLNNDEATTKLTINGGIFNGTDEGDPMALYSSAYGNNTFKNTYVTITGGTFNGHVAFGGGNKNATETVSITGGTFNGDLGRYLANDGWEDITVPTT